MLSKVAKLTEVAAASGGDICKKKTCKEGNKMHCCWEVSVFAAKHM